MKKWFLYACEHKYGGLYGMHSMMVEEFEDSVTEDYIFENCITEMSLELMQSYGIDFYIDREDYDNDDEYYDAITEAMYDDIEGYCKPIRDDITLSTEELNDECYKMGEKLFVKRYCV